jgi:DNA-binding XRE family transcriptional regulator
MSLEQQIQTKRLQSNLTALREIAGLSQQELADEIGVTKMTIRRLELKPDSNPELKSKPTDMTYPQYAIIRLVFDKIAQERIEANSEDVILYNTCKMLLDDELSEDERKKAEEAVKAASGAISGMTATGMAITAASVAARGILPIFGPLGIVAGVGITGASIVGAWLKRSNKKKK